MTKRPWLPWAVGALLLVSLGVTVFRGTHAEPGQIEATGSVGVATCAVRSIDGRKPVECVMIASGAADDVWKRITGYKRVGVLFDSWLWRYRIDDVAPEEDGVTRLRGSVQMWLRDFPIDVRIREEHQGSDRSATWDAPSHELEVDRGGWRVRPIDATKTEVRYSLELTVRGAPNFLVRVLMLDHLGGVVESIVHAPASDG